MSTDSPSSSQYIDPIIWPSAPSEVCDVQKNMAQAIQPANSLTVPTQAPIAKRGRPSNNFLWDSYIAVFSQFCYTFGLNPQLVPLRNPFLYFYYKNDNVYFIRPLQVPVEKHGIIVQQRIPKLTPESWPLFLFTIGLWNNNSAVSDALYYQLTILLSKFKLSELDTYYQQIRIYDPVLADNLNNLSNRTTLSLDGMLLLSVESKDSHCAYRPWSASLLLEQLPSLRNMGPPPTPLRRLLAPYFKAISKRLRSNIRTASHRPRGRPRKTLVPHLTYQINRHMYQIVSPATPAEKNLFQMAESVTDGNKEKCFHISSVWWDSLPPSVVILLRLITDGSVELLNELCKLFYRIMTTNPKVDCISVLCSPQNTPALQHLFSLLFDVDIQPFPYPEGQNAISLNKLTQSKHLFELAEHNLFGRTLLMLQDVVPNNSAIETSDALKAGQPITLTDPYFTDQRFRNRTHLLCITSQKEKAAAMCGRLLIPLVALNAGGDRISTDFSLSEDERSWMLTALPIQGMYLSHGAKSKKTKYSDLPTTTDIGLERFFSTCCCAGNRIPAVDLYEAYCTYYAVVHGQPYPYTRYKFKKTAESYLQNCKGFPNYDYRKLWSPVRKSCRHFTGVVLKDNWRESLSSISTEEIPDDFWNALCRIHSYIPSQLTRPGSPDAYGVKTE